MLSGTPFGITTTSVSGNNDYQSSRDSDLYLGELLMITG